MTLDELRAWQKAKIEAEGGEMFMGIPDRWYEAPGPKWRCQNGHGKQIEMTLIVQPTAEPRTWKVQYFSKDMHVSPDDDGSLAEFVRNAAQELRRRALDAVREG